MIEYLLDQWSNVFGFALVRAAKTNSLNAIQVLLTRGGVNITPAMLNAAIASTSDGNMRSLLESYVAR